MRNNRIWLLAFVAAFQLLTRFPVPRLDRWGKDPFTDDVLRLSVVFYPVAGLAIGGVLAAAGTGLGIGLGDSVPLPVSGALLLALWVGLTGGLHLDGLMDTADGLLSGQPREKMLEIMKDSRAGAMGVIACVLLLIIKTSLLLAWLDALSAGIHGGGVQEAGTHAAGVFATGAHAADMIPTGAHEVGSIASVAHEVGIIATDAHDAGAQAAGFHAVGVHPVGVHAAMLMLVPVWSRWFIPVAMAGWNYARQEGMGGYFRSVRWRHAIAALLVAWVITAMVVWWTGGSLRDVFAYGLVYPMAAGVCGSFVAAGIARKLGGLTGDTYGALVEGLETALLLGAVLWLT